MFRSLSFVIVLTLLSVLLFCNASFAAAETATTTVVAYRVSSLGTERLTSLKSCAEANPESLFLKTGTYCIGGSQWALTQGGGVRFYQPLQWNRYYIVHSGSLESLLSAIAWGISHGGTDNAKPLTELANALKTKKLILTCGKAALLGQYLLKPLGIQSRLVSGLKATPPNHYDDSHALLEVKTPQGWQLVDLDNNRWFVEPTTGSPLSALQVFQRVADGESVQSLAKPLAADAAYAPQSLVATTNTVVYDFDFFSEDNLATPEGLERWSREVFTILGIQDVPKKGNPRYFFRVHSPAEEAQVLSIRKTYVPLKTTDFDARFYGEPH